MSGPAAPVRSLYRRVRSAASAGAVLSAVLAVWLGSLLPTPSHSQDLARDRRRTSGPGFNVGFGNETAGLGVAALYYIQVTEERFRLAPHVGAGVLPSFRLGRETGGRLWGASGGLLASFGRTQRVVMDLYAAPAGWQELRLYGRTLDARPLYGVGLNVGWEMMLRSGWYLRASVGPVFIFSPRLYEEVGTWSVHGNLLSIGYKPW